MEAEQTQLEITKQYVRKIYQGDYDEDWCELVVITEDGEEFSRRLYPKPEEEGQ